MTKEHDPTERAHARYTGDTTVVMPDLAGRARCCDVANHRADDEEGQPNPHTVLEHGDVILLDRWSAENREDFEVLDEPPRKETARKPRKAMAAPTGPTPQEA